MGKVVPFFMERGNFVGSLPAERGGCARICHFVFSLEQPFLAGNGTGMDPRGVFRVQSPAKLPSNVTAKINAKLILF